MSGVQPGLNDSTTSGATHNSKYVLFIYLFLIRNVVNWAGMLTLPNSHPCIACRAPGRAALVCWVVWYQAPGWHDLPADSAPPSPVLDDYAVWQRQWRVLEGSGAVLG